MYVTLLFDVEDLTDPRADDTTLRIAEIFTEEDAISTMMVVGEKARLYEKRGRHDLIQALGQHDLALHTNRHSMHPTVAEYLEGLGWDEGIAEAVARERSGVEDMERIMGQFPSCWGRGGSTWGPQIAPALERLGVPAMIYTFTHLQDRRTHIHRFCGRPTYYWYFGGYDSTFSDDAAFERGWQEVLDQITLDQAEDVPWLSLFVCHPSTVRARTFWDGLNYNHGVNTPPDQWRMSEYRSEADWYTAQRNLRRFARGIANMPGVQLRTIRQMNEMIAPEPTEVAAADLQRLAQQAVAAPVIRPDGPLASPAEALYLWAAWIAAGRPEGAVPFRYVEGPVDEPPAHVGLLSLTREQLTSAALSLGAAVDRSGRLPASVSVAGQALGVGALYRLLAAAVADPSLDPVTVVDAPTVPALGDVLAEEVREGVPGWMHKPDLNVSTHAAYTRLMSWTLKPAALR
ncbi:MAG: hypothetical protein GXX93_04780 [Anaerolineae bacterium]|nr:hypothetical protein [Anaerolineae bacterium]